MNIDWITSNMLMIVAIVAGANVMLSGAVKILNSFKDKTESKVDNSIAKYLGKFSGWLSWLIELIQGNLQHKK